MKAATKKLAEEIKKNPRLAKKYTAEQLQDIAKGEQKIKDLTWHHNEQIGVMELVDEVPHEQTGHTGGNSIWGDDLR